MTTLERAFCPYCFVVVRIEDGLLVRHTYAPEFSRTAGLVGRPCKGSGQKP